MPRHRDHHECRGAGRVRGAASLAHVLVLLTVLTATGCAPTDGGVADTPARTTTAPDPTVSGTTSAPAPPALVPDGTAHDNLAVFAAVTATVWSSEQRASGRAYVDALVAAGFDKAAMQVTPDQTTVGNAAESIQFAVRWDTECLVGQVGPSTGDPVTTVVPGLADGGCLIGQTRTIDW